MIKCNKGVVELEGKRIDLIAELGTLIHSMLDKHVIDYEDLFHLVRCHLEFEELGMNDEEDV